MKKNRAVFLDRDGTINEEVEYLSKADKFVLILGSGEAIRELNKAGFKVVVATNQAGIAKGIFKKEDMIAVNERMIEELKKFGAKIDGIYFCPHHPDFTGDCDCRKPKPGMLITAAKELNIELKNSYCIGDRLKDIEAGFVVGCKTILVLTGYGMKEKEKISTVKPDFIAENLYDGVKRFVLQYQ
ncbi:MAG: D-glycero-beta-D-manno-heptose 1,7-bisphosphate 7-phosphatase [Candidatus Thermoplasmatota archaeon]